HMDCIHCQNLVCVKGDTEKTEMLRRRLAEVQSLMEKANVAVSDGYSGSDCWLEHHRSTADRLSQLCTIMDDPAVPNGAVIQLALQKMPSRIEQATVHGTDAT
ncbi:integrase, partial [Klebsiella pneumoniae]